MEVPARNGSLRGPIAVGALLSLGLLLLRLFGELHGWSPLLFSRDAGGGFALVGIAWLVPLLGIWFAMRLQELGRVPARRGRALLLSFVGLVLLAAPGPVVGDPNSTIPPLGKIALLNTSVIVGATLAFFGWKELGRSLVAFGYLSRLPVVVVMYIAMQKNWGTHFEKGMPGLPEMEFFPKWLVIGVLPQFVTWICFTVIVGSFFGALTALLHGKKEPAATAAA
jgi:hypothetical protein